MQHSNQLAYIVGVALGDGNLSCPNGRASRLRITCDHKYPEIITEISDVLAYLFPNNKVGIYPVKGANYSNISLYSNRLKEILPWENGRGTKHEQNARVPKWIMCNQNYTEHCLRGLIQTDGSIYTDRGYRMVNFTNVTEVLCDDVYSMISSLGYNPYKYKAKQKTDNYKYTIRLSKQVDSFIEKINLTKT